MNPKQIRTPFLALAASCALLIPAASAQAELTRTGGILGGSLGFDMQGAVGDIFVLLPSTDVGPTPLALIDPLDPRSLDVGLDLFDYLVYGALDGAGQGTVTFPVPADPGLAGLTIYTQMMTLPGVGFFFDEISNRVDFVLGDHGDSHLTIGSLPAGLSGYGSVVLDDGRVLMGGGLLDTGLGGTLPTTELRVFDPQIQAFTSLGANLSYATITPTATKLSDGRVLFCGGLGAGSGVVDGASIYDPVTNVAIAAAPIPGPRAQHTATLLNDGRVFVTGGVQALNAADPVAALGDIVATSFLFDPVLNTWTAAASLPLPRIGHSSTILPSGRVLITGGLEVGNLFGIPLPSIVNSSSFYNPVGNTMSGGPSFSGARALHGQIGLADGRVLLVGGADGDVLTQNFFSLDTCRVYSETTNSWSNLPSLPEVRTFPSLIEAGSRVHVLSGVGTIDLTTLTGLPVSNIVSADSITFNWASTGTMVFPRPLSAAHAIDGGERIVILGPGDNGLGTVDLTGEIFIP